MGGSLFYAHHHQQSLEMGTSIVGCQRLHHTVGNTHLLMANIELKIFLESHIMESSTNPHDHKL